MNVVITTVFPEGASSYVDNFALLDRQLKHEGIDLPNSIVAQLAYGVPIVVEAWQMVIELAENF